MRAILVRDPNKMIAAAVLSSPKLTEAEVERDCQDGQRGGRSPADDGPEPGLMKRYKNLLRALQTRRRPWRGRCTSCPRLKDRDIAKLAVDRNIPEPLRVAARKRMAAGHVEAVARYFFRFPLAFLRPAQSDRICDSPSM